MGSREQLTELIDEQAAGRIGDGLAVLLLALPFLAVLGVELLSASAPREERDLRMPWEQEVRPDPPLTALALPATGDLLRMARLPGYAERFEPSPGRIAATDESGYRNPLSGLDDPFREVQRDITLVGASFMVTGRFAESLAQRSGLGLYNAAWAGRGAVFPVLHLLDEDRIGRAGERYLVFGIVQRSLAADRGWPHLAARLDGEGNYRVPTRGSALRAQAREWLRWNQRLDDYLLKTSSAVQAAERLSPYLPPMALDRGATSAVRLGQLHAPWSRPMLFLEETIASSALGFEARGGDTLLAALTRLGSHCASRGVKLVVVLVPDKLQVYLEHVTPTNFRLSGEELRGGHAATTAFAERLRGAGVDAVDLLPHFARVMAEEKRAGLAAAELLYQADDTHWTDQGSELAGEIVAEHLLSE